ncbi:MAG: hypothetical protein JNG83_01505 [Opitutaceae bacterium]|nr:hypothetical protein [Opitutaceae bacterium]
MAPEDTSIRRRVWIGLGFALAVTGAWWVWHQAQPAQAAFAPAPPMPFVRLADSGGGAESERLRERAELFDPTPLFFPTKWNYGQGLAIERVRRQPGQVFGSFEAKFVYADQSLKSYGMGPSLVPDQVMDVVIQGNEAPFAGLGQVDTPRQPLAERAGYIEIRTLDYGKIIIGQSLKELTPPRAEFAPAEFLLVVSPLGVVGEPVLTGTTGWEEVDRYLRDFLVKTYRVGERLNPGRYRVLFGP